MNQPSVQDRAILSAVFAKMDVVAMVVATGALFAVGLFLATVVLLLQDVPAGNPIGPHLNALQDYLPGYSVTWAGSIAGLLNGFIVGAVVGFCIALFWNFTHYIALASIVIKTAILAD
jgi:hypothetical protein